MKNAKPASTAKVTGAKGAKSSSATSPTKTAPIKTAQSAPSARTTSAVPTTRPTLLGRTRLGKLGQFSRKTYQILSLCLIAVVILESVMLFVALHRAPATSNANATFPKIPPVSLPANSDMTLIEFVPPALEMWFYTVPNVSVDAMFTLYTSQAHQHNWTCLDTMKLVNNTRNGQPITGTGVQVSFRENNTQITVVAGDQQYGDILLGDTLDPGTIALRISMEPPPRKGC